MAGKVFSFSEKMIWWYMGVGIWVASKVKAAVEIKSSKRLLFHHNLCPHISFSDKDITGVTETLLGLLLRAALVCLYSIIYFSC